MRKRTIILSIILLFFVVVGLLVYLGISNLEKSLEDLQTVSISTPILSNLKNGTYQGSYQAFPISVKVSVTVVDGKIDNLVLLEHKHGQGGKAESIIQEIQERQTLEIDAIGGATYSSIVILKATESALLQGTVK